MKLHLGCGTVKLAGYHNVDFDKSASAADEACDLTKIPWPWQDGSIDEIYTSHTYEHLPFKATFEESYRILKPHGILHVEVPHGNTYVYLLNPTHCTILSWQSFDPWTAGLSHSSYGITMKWKVLRRKIYFMGRNQGKLRDFINFFVNPVINTFPVIYERFFMYMLPAANLEFVLEKQP
jgi:methyltransferase family protein